MKKTLVMGICLAALISCMKTEITKNSGSIPKLPEAKTESIVQGINTPHTVNSKTVFDEDSVERYDENSYLTLTFRGKKYRLRIATSTLEQNRILNKELPITDEVGVLFAYEKAKLPCVNTNLLQVPVDVIFMDSNARVTKIARESGSVCATTGTQFAMIVPRGFTIKNSIQLNDRIKFADAYKNDIPQKNDVEKDTSNESESTEKEEPQKENWD